MIEHIEFGAGLSEEAAGAEPVEPVIALRVACGANRAFTLVDRRMWESPDTGPSDVLVVDCVNDQVPSRNAAKVMVRERLALVLPRDPLKAPQVRALRKSFPPLMHLNNVPRGEPASLCLYFERWANTRRTWTPERFLQRILFWLTETSKGTLHRAGQPVEAMYFESPIDVVLPPNWEERLVDAEKLLALVPVQRDHARGTFRAVVASRAEANKHRVPQTVAIRVSVPAVVHGGIEPFASTLGELADSLAARGSNLQAPLQAEIARLVGSGGVAPVAEQACLLLVSVPTKRVPDGDVERIDVRGFQVPCDLRTLGVDVGALSEFVASGKHYPVTILGEGVADASSAVRWRDIPVVPVTVRESITARRAREASGIGDDGADEKRVLAGIGALGSSLADLWWREAWGQWTLVDPDFLQPHNLVRHLARDCHLGHYKVDVVQDILRSTYPLGVDPPIPFRGDVVTTTNSAFAEDLKKAKLLVDATTTLEVPRELSRREDVPRCVSRFSLPRATAACCSMEDAKREVRLDDLEAQYYGAILAEPWGADHLVGHNGELWGGAGCRDISLILSNELVQVHAAILARQIRLRSVDESAQVRIWSNDETTSGVQIVNVPIRKSIRRSFGAWTVVSHDGVSEKLRGQRAARLPKETGGVIVGYIDHPLKSVFVVDVLAAPADSEESEGGFVRGIEGLTESIRSIAKRTAGIVGYIGEWHSHPPRHSPQPSGDDIYLLAHCARTLALEGVPGLMLIVGENGEIVLVGCSRGKLNRVDLQGRSLTGRSHFIDVCLEPVLARPSTYDEQSSSVSPDVNDAVGGAFPRIEDALGDVRLPRLPVLDCAKRLPGPLVEGREVGHKYPQALLRVATARASRGDSRGGEDSRASRLRRPRR